ncbi:MAG TPA: metallophosphoesterase family protein [Sphingobium sp.]|nr:metallophosphoesterase family protein [Sphingobium sp.]
MSLWRRLRGNKEFSTNGCRIYAIGDVHGCFPLLVRLLQEIERDQKERQPKETHVVLLGDYIDRGPQSREVCQLLHAMNHSHYFHCLRGNHEQTMLDVLGGDRMALRFWLKYGGEETLLSWGIEAWLIERAYSSESAQIELIQAFRRAVPPSFITWLGSLPSHHVHGNYLFVHAGIRPHARLDEQVDDDLLWIREPFLSSTARHPWRVVHGHSVTSEVDIRHNRIGVDTGAFRSGVLSAVGIEEDVNWVLQACAP